MKIRRAGQIYTQLDIDGKDVIHFWIAELEKLSGHLPVYTLEINGAFAEKMFQNCGIEQSKLDQLTSEHLEIPFLFCEMIPATTTTPFTGLLVDGHHRYYKRWLRGDTRFAARICPRSMWEQAVTYE